MKTIYFLFILSLSFFTLNANARKPAVEDFVGVVPKDYKETPKGTEVLFDFNKKVEQLKQQNPNKRFELAESYNLPAILASISFIALPFFMWLFISRYSIKIEPRNLPTPDGDDDNVHHLDRFRNDKDDEKKVS